MYTTRKTHFRIKNSTGHNHFSQNVCILHHQIWLSLPQYHTSICCQTILISLFHHFNTSETLPLTPKFLIITQIESPATKKTECTYGLQENQMLNPTWNRKRAVAVMRNWRSESHRLQCCSHPAQNYFLDRETEPNLEAEKQKKCHIPGDDNTDLAGDGV